MNQIGIENCSFELKSLNEDAYELDVKFLGKKNVKISNATIVFKQEKLVSCGETVDIYSQNGVSTKNIQELFTSEEHGLFKPADLKGMAIAARKMQTTVLNGPTVIALDMKDEEKSYLQKYCIREVEAGVCAFFQQKKPQSKALGAAEKVRALIQKELPCDFILAEGTLKSDIIHTFSEKEAEWFLTTKTGAIKFCQCAEFYMNAFKLGQAPDGMFADDYFHPISSSAGSFQPQSKSTVWYPESYKQIYSLNGKFSKTMKKVFSLEGSEGYDIHTGITSISVEMKS